MDIGLMTGTITSLRFASEIAKSFLSLKIDVDVQSKVIELQSCILSAQGCAMEANAQQMEMIEQIRALKSQLTEMTGWIAEAKRYKLIEPWDNGSLVYALRTDAKENEPAHYICTKCFVDARKSILNPADNGYGQTVYRCPHCKSEARTGHRGAVSAIYAPDN